MAKVQVPTPQEWNARLTVLVEAIAVLTQDEPTLTREVESGPEHMGAMARRFLDAAELLEACARAMRLAESRIVEASCRQQLRDGASHRASRLDHQRTSQHRRISSAARLQGADKAAMHTRRKTYG